MPANDGVGRKVSALAQVDQESCQSKGYPVPYPATRGDDLAVAVLLAKHSGGRVVVAARTRRTSCRCDLGLALGVGGVGLGLGRRLRVSARRPILGQGPVALS